MPPRSARRERCRACSLDEHFVRLYVGGLARALCLDLVKADESSAGRSGICSLRGAARNWALKSPSAYASIVVRKGSKEKRRAEGASAPRRLRRGQEFRERMQPC